MLVVFALATAALAGGLALDLDATEVAEVQATFAVMGASGYLGMATADGAATADGGAVVVVRYTPAGQTEPAWLEGVTVDADGALVKVVRREGRRLRTLTPTADGVLDVVTEGRDRTPIVSATHAVEGDLVSPWLVGLGLVSSQPSSGATWDGFLVDGAVRGIAPATLTALGKRSVGGGRSAQVAALAPDEGPARSFVYDRDALSVVLQPEDSVQWVASDRDQVQATHQRSLD